MFTRTTNRTRNTVSRRIISPKFWMPTRKGGRRRRLLECAGDRAELGFAPGRQDQRLGGSAHHRASHEHQIGWEGGLARGRGGGWHGVLLGWIGLAGEQRFIDVKVAGFDQPGIGGHEIRRPREARYRQARSPSPDLDRLSVAQRLGGIARPSRADAPRRFRPGAPAPRRGSPT